MNHLYSGKYISLVVLNIKFIFSTLSRQLFNFEQIGLFNFNKLRFYLNTYSFTNNYLMWWKLREIRLTLRGNNFHYTVKYITLTKKEVFSHAYSEIRLWDSKQCVSTTDIPICKKEEWIMSAQLTFPLWTGKITYFIQFAV